MPMLAEPGGIQGQSWECWRQAGYGYGSRYGQVVIDTMPSEGMGGSYGP